jgi:aspartyl-tRNA(Asn)/glutamyl-tRNA(Gln) amidotransferase subunit A
MTMQTINEIQAGYRQKKWSVAEVTDTYFKKINQLDGKIKAYLTLAPEKARARAAALDQELVKDPTIIDQQKLFGIPYGAKDLYSTAGIRTTAGSRVLENYLPPYNATAVARIDTAGGILLGKLNQDAWAHGSSGENSDFFPTHNPWNLDYVPGGSSSGSAAAVAAGMAVFTLGTDTGGSIRCPASFCGVTGLKPTYGRVSRYGVVAMASSLDSIGHLTRNVADAALVLAVTAGQDPLDATTPPVAVENYQQLISHGIKGLTIGVPNEYIIRGEKNALGVTPEVQAITEKTLEQFERLGAKVRPVSLPHTPQALATYYIIQPAEVSSNLARYDGNRFGRTRDQFGAEAKRRIMLGTYILSAGYYEAYYHKAMQVRTLVCRDFADAFRQVDVIIGPVMPHGAFKLGEKVNDPLALYLEDVLTVPVNLAGLPALAVPAGFDGHDLPVGIQIIGPQFSEKTLFQVGQAYQQVTDWHKKEPPIAA